MNPTLPQTSQTLWTLVSTASVVAPLAVAVMVGWWLRQRSHAPHRGH